MKQLLLIAVLATASCAVAEDAPPPPTETPAEAVARESADHWLEKIAARADEIQTLTARVRLHQITGLLGDEQTQVGELTYAAGPPPRFAVHFQGHIVNNALRERDQRYVFDGHWLGEFNTDDKTLMRYELVPPGESADDLLALGKGPFPLPLSMDKQAVLRQFQVELVDQTEEAVTLGFRARSEDAKFQRIDIEYDRETLLPHSIEAVHGEDQTNVDLRDIKTDSELPEGVFQTTAPDDAWTVQENPVEQ